MRGLNPGDLDLWPAVIASYARDHLMSTLAMSKLSLTLHQMLSNNMSKSHYINVEVLTC